MTVQQLLEKLMRFDPELEVFFEDAEWGPTDVTSVAFNAAARRVVTDYKTEMTTVQAFKDGQPIDVQVPKVVTVYTDTGGVVLS